MASRSDLGRIIIIIIIPVIRRKHVIGPLLPKG